MLLQNMDRNTLQKILFELDQALYNHQQWHNALVRTLACRLLSDKHDIGSSAHKECRFGQWYYGVQSEYLKDNTDFVAIGEVHLRMHKIVSTLLLDLKTENAIKLVDYDHFSNLLDQFRLEAYALKNEIESMLYKHDPLTMLLNRISMLPLLREEQELSRRQQQSCCISMIDIDFFKKVNDTYGHPVGDKVLIILAKILRENVRSYDKVFRYGGEEFLIVYPQTDIAHAVEMTDRIRMKIFKTEFDVGLEKPVHIEVSCGVSLLDSNAGIELSLERVDSALYQAKSNGRNQTKISSFVAPQSR